ncbi:WD domain, g-beta repeat domain-containing protein [Ditylenchus destructor]|nr:WD domain, g-beta repeat domain-containing protein [Ditylenchus destructor]
MTATERMEEQTNISMDDREQSEVPSLNGGQQPKNVALRLFTETGDELSPAPIVVPVTVSVDQLQVLCNKLMSTTEDPVPISFRSEDGLEIVESLVNSLTIDKLGGEKPIQLVCLPQAVFRVRPVTRCTSSLPGHQQPVLTVQFSPDGRNLASGSGDTTVRLWDLQTELPFKTCQGHSKWILCVAWAPNGKKLASACKNGTICLWDPNNGNMIGRKMEGHKQWVTSIAWNPLHQDPQSRLLASAGKDSTVRIWDTIQGVTIRSLNGHTASVTCIRWGGCGLIYTGSQDRTIKVWRVEDGTLCRNLDGHAHWINTLALNVDYVLRTSCFSPEDSCKNPPDGEMQELAKKRYETALKGSTERLVSGSDDFTLFLWEPAEKKQHIARMTGHQQLVNQVMFSPDTRYIASASFDKSIKLWCGRTGKYISSFRGHVRAVYQISWSADSRLLVSGSADSTLKVWEVRTHKLLLDLPGHGDEVFVVDWSPDGERVVSGGKDTLLKLWRR